MLALQPLVRPTTNCSWPPWMRKKTNRRNLPISKFAATGGSLTGRNGNVKFPIAACVHPVADIKCRDCSAGHFDWQGTDIANQAILLYHHIATLLCSVTCVVLPATQPGHARKCKISGLDTIVIHTLSTPRQIKRCREDCRSCCWCSCCCIFDKFGKFDVVAEQMLQHRFGEQR